MARPVGADVHARTGQLANESRPTEAARLVALDRDGLGYIAVAGASTGHGALFDINNSGFADAMDWVGPHFGVLGLDRHRSGRLD